MLRRMAEWEKKKVSKKKITGGREGRKEIGADLARRP